MNKLPRLSLKPPTPEQKALFKEQHERNEEIRRASLKPRALAKEDLHREAAQALSKCEVLKMTGGVDPKRLEALRAFQLDPNHPTAKRIARFLEDV